MKKSLLLIAVMLIGIFADSKANYGFNEESLPPALVPNITFEQSNVTRNSIFIRLEDTNPAETSIELRYSGGGNTVTTILPAGSVFNLPISGLMPKTTYSFIARAIDLSGPGVFSAPVFATTLVDSPPIPTLTEIYNCPTQVGIAWTVPSRGEDVAEYVILKSFDNSSFVNIGSPSPGVMSFYDFDPINGRTIFYKIIARNVSGTSQSQSIAVAVKPYTGPKDPINVTSSKTDKSRNHLTISWQNPQEDTQCGSDIRANYLVLVKLYNETDYKVYADLYPGATSVRIDGLKPKDVVDYRILAFSDKGLQGNRVGGRDTTAGPPYPPTNLIIVALKDALGNSVLDASWKDNSNDEDYFIAEVSTDSVNFKQFAKMNFNQNLIRHQPIEEGTKYFYRVKAGSNTEGDSPYTPVSFGITFQYSVAPAAPYALTGKLVASKAELKWFDDSNREASFDIERSVDNQTSFTLLKSEAKNTTSYTDATVAAGKTYYYRVRAKNPIGNSAYSNIAEVKVAGTTGAALDAGVSLFPNPTVDYAKIAISETMIGKAGKITILDQSNRVVFEKSVKNFTDEFIVPASNFKEGLYMISINSGDQNETKRFYKY